MDRLNLELLKDRVLPNEYRHLFDFSIRRKGVIGWFVTHFDGEFIACRLNGSQRAMDDSRIWCAVDSTEETDWVLRPSREIVKILRLDLTEVVELVSVEPTGLGWVDDAIKIAIAYRLHNG